MKVVVSEFMDKAALQAFGSIKVCYEPELAEDPIALEKAASDADALIVRNRTQVTARLLDNAPRLKVVGRLGVGLDNIDLEACDKHSVAVCPAIGANAQSVAEYVVATTLMLLRGAFCSNDLMVAGKWPQVEACWKRGERQDHGAVGIWLCCASCGKKHVCHRNGGLCLRPVP